MKQVKRLYDHLNNGNVKIDQVFPKPYQGQDENQVRILYVACLNDQSGLYRMALPTLELNDNGYSVVLRHFLKNNNGQLYIENYNVFIEDSLEEWADYVVFPTTSEPLDFIINDIKSCNPRAIVCMDVDKNYHNLPKMSYDYQYYNPERKKGIVSNMAKVDMIIAPDIDIATFYEAEIKKSKSKTPKFAIFPNLVSDYMLANAVEFAEKNPRPPKSLGKDDPFKLLIYADMVDYEDVNANRDIIEKIQIKYPQVQVVLYGESLTWKGRNALRGINYTHVKPKSIFNTLTDLLSINPDLCFIPILHRSKYYRHNYKILDCSSLAIPILSYNISPYNKFKEIIFVGEKKKQITEILEDLIQNRGKLIDKGIQAQDSIFSSSGYSSNVLRRIDDVFYSPLGLSESTIEKPVFENTDNTSSYQFRESVALEPTFGGKNADFKESIQFTEM